MLRVLPGLLVVVLTVYAVVDCVQTDRDRVRNLPKLVWIVLVLLFPVAGPLAWFVAGRPSLPWSGTRWGPGGTGRGPAPRSGPPPPKGPDDDPDFLNKL